MCTASPYVFSGTEVYEKGKYISDGSFSSEVVDAQPGIYFSYVCFMER